MFKNRLTVVLFSIVLSAICQAQSNDIGVLGGGLFSPGSAPTFFACPVGFPNCNADTSTRSVVAIEGVLAHRFLNLRLASLHLELPVLGTPNRDLGGPLGFSYASVFFTPGLRVKFHLPLLSPFVSAGGGLAHFSGNSANGSNTTGALQVGGGVDVSTPIPLIGLRGEVREFYTGQPNFSSTHNNVFVGGGIVLKF